MISGALPLVYVLFHIVLKILHGWVYESTRSQTQLKGALLCWVFGQGWSVLNLAFQVFQRCIAAVTKSIRLAVGRPLLFPNAGSKRKERHGKERGIWWNGFWAMQCMSTNLFFWHKCYVDVISLQLWKLLSLLENPGWFLVKLANSF